MKDKIIKTGAMQRAAAIDQTSYKAETGTFTVVFATETPVRMNPWWADEAFNEVLAMSGMRTERLDAGAPLLDNHSQYGAVGEKVLGVVVRHWVEGTKAYAEIKISQRDELKSLRQDIQDGIIKNISCGYRVFSYSERPRAEGEKMRTYIAEDWEPTEISLVPVGADVNSGVRSENNEQFETNLKLVETMPDPKNPVIPGTEPEGGVRSGETPPVNPAVDPAVVAVQAVAAERARVKEINDSVRSLGLTQEFADDLINEGVTADDARKRAISEWAKKDPKVGRTSGGVIVVTDGRDSFRNDAIAALSLRSGEIGSKFITTNDHEAAANFRGLTLLDLAKRALENLGVDYRGMDKLELVKRAITSNQSDLPVILEGTNRRILLANYEATADTWRQFCSVGSVGDFREYKRLRIGSFSRLDKVLENAEYKNKKINDAEFEKVKAETFGNTINLSRQMIVNDDLGAFTRLAAMLGRAAARSIEQDVYKLLAENAGLGPTMNDGLTLFHATHGNIATAGAPSVDVFDAMRVLMAQQMDPDKNDYLDLRPEIGLFPISLGGNARVIIGAQYDPDTANKLQKPNKVNGLLSQIVDTARLTGTRYYMFANPATDPTLEVSFLDGVQTPYMENETTFDVDGMRWKIRLDYGVGAVGWRGAITNAGA